MDWLTVVLWLVGVIILIGSLGVPVNLVYINLDWALLAWALPVGFAAGKAIKNIIS